MPPVDLDPIVKESLDYITAQLEHMLGDQHSTESDKVQMTKMVIWFTLPELGFKLRNQLKSAVWSLLLDLRRGVVSASKEIENIEMSYSATDLVVKVRWSS